MADLSWIDALKFGSASGLIAGVANQAAGYLRDISGFRNTARAQKEEREHQALLRDEAAHAEARSTFLPLMEDARYWISYEWGREFGLEVEYHGGNLIPPALTGPATVLNNLDRVSTGHPTRTIRAAARALHDEFDGVYNMIRDGEADQPAVENFNSWLKQADQIIEHIHEPRIVG